MHTELIRESEEHGGDYPIEVADATDITCDCGKIVDIDDSVMCEICEKRFCESCVLIKHTFDHRICYGCFDEMLFERLSREN